MPVPSSNQLRVFGAFSRRVKAGMQRLAVDASSPDLLASAYVGTGNRGTIVLLNRSTATMEVDLNWPGMPFDTLELTDPYHENTVSALDAIKSPAKAGRVKIEPGSLVTLTNVPLGGLPTDFRINGD